MAEHLNFSLVSPSKLLFSGEVEHVVAPGIEGEFGVLPNHAPFMSALQNGLVRILEGGNTKERIYVQGGFADVTPEGLTILAERAVNLSELDIETLQAKLTKIQGEMAAQGDEAAQEFTDSECQYLEDVIALLKH